MRADEFLVERFLKMENKLKAEVGKCEELQADLEAAMEDIGDFEKLCQILAKNMKTNPYGVIFTIKNYTEDGAEDLEYLSNYFDIDLNEKNVENE